jgi:FAD dependent oxidoreductase TIGR03364
MNNHSAIVIGAGIVGLGTARALAMHGFSVKVFERGEKAAGASIRNFGMIWPIGQPEGKQYERAIHGRAVWKEIAAQSGIWFDAVGSLHVAYHRDEADVLEEFCERSKGLRKLELLSPAEVVKRSGAVVAGNLICGMFSPDELIVDPRQAMEILPRYLRERYGVEFYWNKCISHISDNIAYVGSNEKYKADLIFVCSGADFETLYPEEFSRLPLTKCKLQMMRIAAQPGKWRMGPALCAGLSLIHYSSFSKASSLQQLRKRFEKEMSEYIRWGIHVMVAQNEIGELVIGDSHEYGLTQDPFDKYFINKLILDYLSKFAYFKDQTLIESWNGIYAKLTNGETDIFVSPQPGIYIVSNAGGAGMTLSFGFAEEIVKTL